MKIVSSFDPLRAKQFYFYAQWHIYTFLHVSAVPQVVLIIPVKDTYMRSCVYLL